MGCFFWGWGVWFFCTTSLWAKHLIYWVEANSVITPLQRSGPVSGVLRKTFLISLKIKKTQVLCAGGGGEGVCAAWPSLGAPLGAGRTGYVSAGQAPRSVLSSLMLPDPVSAAWGGGCPHRHLLACCRGGTGVWGRGGPGAGSRARSLPPIWEILCSPSARGGGKQSGGE